jgi:hypothetical protein
MVLFQEEKAVAVCDARKAEKRRCKSHEGISCRWKGQNLL